MKARTNMKNNDFNELYENSHNLDCVDKNNAIMKDLSVKNDLNMEEESLSLNIEELLRLELLSEKKNRINIEMNGIKSSIENKNLSIQNLELRVFNIRNEISNLNSQTEGKRSELRRLQDEYNECIKSISDKYDLSDSWGYDSDTGIISLIPKGNSR